MNAELQQEIKEAANMASGKPERQFGSTEKIADTATPAPFDITQPQTIPAAPNAKPLSTFKPPVVAGADNADTFKRTNHAWQSWLRQNYGNTNNVFGPGRYDAHGALSAQLNTGGPAAIQAYRNRMRDTVDSKALNPRRDYSLQPRNDAPAFTGKVGPRDGQTTMLIGTKEAPIDSFPTARGAFLRSPPHLTQYLRGSLLAHELEHVNQERSPENFEENLFAQRGFTPTAAEKETMLPETDTRLTPLIPSAHGMSAEAPAILTEVAHAADAVRHATGQPLEGDMAFVPEQFGGGYSMPLEEIVTEARRAGIIDGKNTTTDVLNTPAAQAWMQMQADKFNTQYPQDFPREKQNSWFKAAELAPDVQLQPHQERVKEKFEEDNPRMLLYHGLGSGKSLSAIAAAEAAKATSGDDYGIVVPASLKGNFQKELEKFTTGSSPEIMSYTGLGLGKKFKAPPGTIIMDEAHRVRNPAGSAAHAARDAAYTANRLLLLTGSPITNSPTDLANLISLLKRQPISPQDFEKKYIGSKKVYPGLFNYLRGITPGQQAVIKNEGELRGMLRGHVDYQPSKTPEGVNVNEETVRAPLTQAQQKIQKALRTKIPPSFLWKLDTEFPLNKDELSRLNSFLTGLRQNSVSTAPFRRDGDPLKAFQQSGKLQLALKKLRETIDEDPRRKAIIYSNHIGAGLDPYAAALAANNIPYGMFHGGVPTKQRQQALKDYNEGKLRALLIGPAGAEGLSTKGTNLIQILDPHWHESRTQQARGRGLRFDSHDDLPEELKNVHVQRFISESEEPSWLGKLLGYRRERTGDEILERLSREKEKFNEKFRQLLREVGSENHDKYQKKAGVDWLQTSIDAMPMIALGGLGSLPGTMAESPTTSTVGAGLGATLGSLLAWRNANQRNKLRVMAGEPMPDNKSLFDYELPVPPAVLAALGIGGAGAAYALTKSAWTRFSEQEKQSGVRFYRRLPINKNMALNLSFAGPSLTLRKLIPGTSLTLGNRAPRMYVSTPIPGLAYQQYISPKKQKIKAEKDFPDEPREKDDEPDNRTTWQKVRDFMFGSSYGDTDDDE